jgi:hypothetical protein
MIPCSTKLYDLESQTILFKEVFILFGWKIHFPFLTIFYRFSRKRANFELQVLHRFLIIVKKSYLDTQYAI